MICDLTIAKILLDKKFLSHVKPILSVFLKINTTMAVSNTEVLRTKIMYVLNIKKHLTVIPFYIIKHTIIK